MKEKKTGKNIFFAEFWLFGKLLDPEKEVKKEWFCCEAFNSVEYNKVLIFLNMNKLNMKLDLTWIFNSEIWRYYNYL